MPDKPRRYDAPGREAQARLTRSRILAAAHELFAQDGFAVPMRVVAQRAGVSVATVELLFGTKAALLGAVVDVALAGDDDPVPILDRPWVSALKVLSAGEFLRTAGVEFASGAGRVAPVLRALEEASTRSADLTEVARELGRRRSVMAAWVVDQVIDRAALASDLTRDTAIATVLVLLDPAAHRRLLLDHGWPPDRLGAWLARSLQRLLL